MTQTLADPVAEAKRVINWARERGVTVRALGGVAVCLQAPDGAPRVRRRVRDIDFAIPQDGGRSTTGVMEELGYEADKMFNTMHGAGRLLFADGATGRHVDVFVGEFRMCHNLRIADRLDVHEYTIPITELLLTKLQIVELTETDQRDIVNLCYHHDLAESEDGGIEGEMIARLCAHDWGLWRTCTANLDRSGGHIREYGLSGGEEELVAGRLEKLRRAIDAEPKSRAWRLRNKVGARVRWYALPEEERDVQ